MDIATDASSIINLFNGGALGIVAQLDHCELCVSPLVAGECDPTCAAELKGLSDSGQIKLVNSDEIPAQLYLNLLNQYQLGEGETECIALCCVTDHHFCCDDNKARQIASGQIGDDRVLGSLRLLRWSAIEKLISPAEAFAIYERMLATGGFLPNVPFHYFEEPEF